MICLIYEKTNSLTLNMLSNQYGMAKITKFKHYIYFIFCIKLVNLCAVIIIGYFIIIIKKLNFNTLASFIFRMSPS